MKVEDDKESDAAEASCLFLPKPEAVAKACNHHCRVQWVQTYRSNCSERCGTGQQKIQKKCMKIMMDETQVRMTLQRLW